jgi:hypothetical protein
MTKSSNPKGGLSCPMDRQRRIKIQTHPTLPLDEEGKCEGAIFFDCLMIQENIPLTHGSTKIGIDSNKPALSCQ